MCLNRFLPICCEKLQYFVRMQIEVGNCYNVFYYYILASKQINKISIEK